MSQIETIMLVTLGFVVAALLALFFGRLIWSYAVTLGKRRTERSAPATIAALQAERDQLRAEAAMLSRKLELRLDDLKTRLAEQAGEVSRNRNRIDHLIKEVEKRNAAITEREEQIDHLNKHIEPLEIELATRTQAMQQFKEQLRDRDDELSSATSAQSQIEVQLAERNREIAGLQGEIANREAKHKEISIEAETAQERLQSQIQDLTSLSKQIEQQRSDMSAQYEQFTKLQTEAIATETRSARKSKATNKTKIALKKTKGVPDKVSNVTMGRKFAKDAAKSGSETGGNEIIVDEKVKLIQSRGQDLEQKIIDAERETDQLQDELKKLDDVWAQKIAALTEAAPKTIEKRSKSKAAKTADADDDDQSNGRSRQNVISLAARIRALQKKSAEN